MRALFCEPLRAVVQPSATEARVLRDSRLRRRAVSCCVRRHVQNFCAYSLLVSWHLRKKHNADPVLNFAEGADAMGKLLDDDFVFTDYDGTIMSKPQFLDSIRDKSYQLSVEASDSMKLHRHGDTVVVIGATHEKGTFKGKPYQHQGRFTDTWMKKNGQWLCIASHLSAISKPA